MKTFLIILIESGIMTCMLLSGCKERTVADSRIEGTDYYTEMHRPQVHFTPESKWMNDPNGMVFHDDKYHLFYQYFPDSTVWGPMHWGHAVSKDLVHWEHWPIALYPDSLGWIFSGSAVVDAGNTSGLGQGGRDPIVAVFTHHNDSLEKEGKNDFQYQSIAYSNDGGKTFNKYSGNPVLKNPGIRDFRDPKVFRHAPSGLWVMVLAAYDKAMFYTSPNLIDWTYTGSFGIPGDQRLWECPDLFMLKSENSDDTKWVLIVSIQQQAPNGGTATGYFVGDFDGKSFKGDYHNLKWLDYGTDNYAMVTWSNTPDSRTLAIGWMSNWLYAQKVPTAKWRSAMTLPRSLKLFKTQDDFIVRSLPVEALAALKGDSLAVYPDSLHKLFQIPSVAKIRLKFKKPDKGILNLRFSNTTGEYLDIGYDVSKQSYFVDRSQAGASDFYPEFAARHYGSADYESEFIDLLLFFDHASVELFADDGQCVMTEIFFPSVPFSQLTYMGEHASEHFVEGAIMPLRSIWIK